MNEQATIDAIKAHLIEPLPAAAVLYVAACLMTDDELDPGLKLGVFDGLAQKAGTRTLKLAPMHEACARLFCLGTGRGATGDNVEALQAALKACGAEAHAETAWRFMFAMPEIVKRAGAQPLH